jgi:hypothetical protein
LHYNPVRRRCAGTILQAPSGRRHQMSREVSMSIIDDPDFLTDAAKQLRAV